MTDYPTFTGARLAPPQVEALTAAATHLQALADDTDHEDPKRCWLLKTIIRTRTQEMLDILEGL